MNFLRDNIKKSMKDKKLNSNSLGVKISFVYPKLKNYVNSVFYPTLNFWCHPLSDKGHTYMYICSGFATHKIMVFQHRNVLVSRIQIISD